MLGQIVASVLLVLGEALCVYAEMAAAQSQAPFSAAFSRNFVLIAVAGAMLIGGYILGYASFKNIWVVSVISVTSILIVEPLLTYFIFQELPPRGATIGLIFGALGFGATLVL